MDSANLLTHRLRREGHLSRTPLIPGGIALTEKKEGIEITPAQYTAASLNEGLRLAEKTTHYTVYRP